MIAPRQIRAARALLGWTQQDLADKAILSLNAVKRIEAQQSDPRVSTLAAIRAALEAGGAVFLSAEHGHGSGVRMRTDETSEKSSG